MTGETPRVLILRQVDWVLVYSSCFVAIASVAVLLKCWRAFRRELTVVKVFKVSYFNFKIAPSCCFYATKIFRDYSLLSLEKRVFIYANCARKIISLLVNKTLSPILLWSCLFQVSNNSQGPTFTKSDMTQKLTCYNLQKKSTEQTYPSIDKDQILEASIILKRIKLKSLRGKGRLKRRQNWFPWWFLQSILIKINMFNTWSFSKTRAGHSGQACNLASKTCLVEVVTASVEGGQIESIAGAVGATMKRGGAAFLTN